MASGAPGIVRLLVTAPVLIAIAVACAAQESQASSTLAKPDEGTPRLAATGRIVISKGTPISLRLAEYLDPRSAQVGQSVRLVAGANMRLDQAIIVSRGAIAEGHLEYVKPARRLSRNSELGIRVDWVESTGGEKIPLQALTHAKGPQPGEAGDRQGQGPGLKGTVTPPQPTNAGPSLAAEAVTALVLIFSKGQNLPAQPGSRLRAAVADDVELEMAPLLAAQKRFPDPGGTAMLHFYRPDDSQPYRPTIYCQGKKIVRLARNRHFSLELPAGKYECRANDQPPVSFELLGGEEYFLRTQIRLLPKGEDPGKLKWALGVRVYWNLVMADSSEGEDAIWLTKEEDKKNVYESERLQPPASKQK